MREMILNATTIQVCRLKLVPAAISHELVDMSSEREIIRKSIKNTYFGA